MDDSSPQIAPVGDGALLVTFGVVISPALNRRVLALVAALEAEPLDGSAELVLGYASLLVYYDCLQLGYDQVEAWVRQRLAALEFQPAGPARRVEIQVHYGGEYGPDLPYVAHAHGLTPADVIRLHSQRDYPVYMMGFTPGFPYLGEMDPLLATPRLSTPRSRVPAGSVGIAGEQTGIYPLDSPGGWRIIGWTPQRLFDPYRQPPFLLAPGDLVRFIPVV